jgi:protoporphyrinogen oxidase
MPAISPVAIVGGGLAGLVSARLLKLHNIPFVLFEGGNQIGGLARSHVDEEGFVYDFGAHFINNRLAAALGISAECRDVALYGESVLLGGKEYAYPFGLLRKPRFLRDGVLATLRGVIGPKAEHPNAASWFRAQYGRTLADEVAVPLLEGWSGIPAEELAPSVGEKFTNSAFHTLYLKAMSRLTGRAVAIGYSHELEENPNVWHVYPLGGIARACERLASEVTEEIQLKSPVQEILVDDGCVRAVRARGELTEVSAVISTAPAPVLAGLVRGDSTLDDVRALSFRPMVFVNLRYSQRPILPTTVLWTPEKKYPFFRLTETARSMPWLAPEGQTMLTCDIGDIVNGPFWKMGDEELGRLCAEAVHDLYPETRHKYKGCRVLRIPGAYPVFRKSYEQVRKRLEAGTGIRRLYSVGRNGEFAHILMEDVYWRTCRKINALIADLRADRPANRARAQAAG